MDLSIAYDCIPHDLLTAKLEAYGFKKNALKLVYSYLTNRTQKVKIGSTYSSEKHILNGVPQGSVLRPLLLNIWNQRYVTLLMTRQFTRAIHL